VTTTKPHNTHHQKPPGEHVPNTTTAVTTRPTTYTVSALPEDDINADLFAITVEYRGRGLWAVKRLSQCLAADGSWSYEPTPSGREDDWLAEHRFSREEALRLAEAAAPGVTVNGITVAEALRRTAAAGRGEAL
jgi:hypothetical protein